MATATVKNLATGGMSAIMGVDRRDPYISPAQFAELFKDETPFLWLSLKNRQTGLKDPLFKMFQYENTYMRRYFYNNGSTVTIGAASAGAATESSAVTIDNVTGYGSTTTIDSSFVHKVFEVYDSTWVTDPTLATLKGVVLLTDDASTTTAAFKNLTTTAVSTVDNDVFVEITNAQEDGSEAPDAIASELAIVWNQCQQFKTAIQLEGEILYASLRGENNEFMRLVAEYTKAHKLNIEGAFLRGSNPVGLNLAAGDTFTQHDALTGDTGKVVRSTMGIITALNKYGSSSGQYQNLWSFAQASASYSDFVDMSEKIFQFYPPNGELYAVSGPTAYSYWSKLLYARGKGINDNWTVQFAPQGRDSFGVNVRVLSTPNGDLKLTKSDAMKFENAKKMVVVDDRNIKYMEYRPTEYKADIKKDNAYDGRKDQIFTDAGIGITHIKTHNLITLT